MLNSYLQGTVLFVVLKNQKSSYLFVLINVRIVESLSRLCVTSYTNICTILEGYPY